MFVRTHVLTSRLKVAALIPLLIVTGRLFHRQAPLYRNPPLDRVNSTSGIAMVFVCLRGKMLSACDRTLSLSARYPGWPDETTRCTVVKVWNAVSCITDIDLAFSSSVGNGVSCGRPVWRRKILFCTTCNFLLSSFVKAENRLLFSSKLGIPHTFPNNCRQ